MNRYFLYLVFLNMVINGIMFVPKIFIEYRYQGAVMAVIIAIPIGISLSYLFSRSITKFQGKGLPEIAADSKRRWLKIIHLGGIQFQWFFAGLLTLDGFVDILSRFVNPEENRLYLLFIYLAAIILIIQMTTERVMYLLEIILFLSIPFIGFIIYKAFTSDELSWDSIWEVGTHVLQWPSLTAIAAATYVFSGYSNLIIFNRDIQGNLKIWNFLVILVLGVFNLFTTFFIPIGFHGSDGAQEYLYPWVSTADSLRLVYSPVERVIFLFLMLYMGIAMMSISVHWHVAFELLKGAFAQKESSKRNWLIISIYAACAALAVSYLNTVLLYKITGYWLIFRLGFEMLYVMLFSFWARRKTA